jgi:hypothetical protein
MVTASQERTELHYSFDKLESQVGPWRRTVLGWEQTSGIETDDSGRSKPSFRHIVLYSKSDNEAALIAGDLLPFACAGFLVSFGVWALTSLPSSSKSRS